MSAARYTGPERREDGHLEGEAVILAALESIKEHFDARITTLEAKVEPLHEYLTTVRTGSKWLKYFVYVGVPIISVWAILKGWIVAWAAWLVKP